MTKKLEDLLNLPDSKEIIETAKAQESEQRSYELEKQQEAFRDIEEFDKIASALPAVKGLGNMADDELNDIAQRALTAYDDLMDLGMNVESRYASRVFEVAGGMLKTSLDAKTAKLDKKLKMIDLQLKKATLDARLAREAKARGEEVEDGQGQAVDRNQLLMEILGRNNQEK